MWPPTLHFNEPQALIRGCLSTLSNKYQQYLIINASNRKYLFTFVQNFVFILNLLAQPVNEDAMLFRNLLLTLLCLSGKAIFIEAQTPASKYKKFLKPCFADEHYEEELISEACTADSCPKRENKETTKSKKEGNEEDFKLFRLDGVKVNS